MKKPVSTKTRKKATQPRTPGDAIQSCGLELLTIGGGLRKQKLDLASVAKQVGALCGKLFAIVAEATQAEVAHAG